MVNFLMLKKIAARARLDIIHMLNKASSGHTGGSLSIIDALTTLYFSNLLNYDAKDPHWKDRDRVILSKGHCAPALYVTLAYAGFFPQADLATLRKFGSHLQGHTDLTKTPGVESCGGPLGQGLSVSVGLAIAAMINKQNYKTYAIIGDGESAKGTITEAAKLAGVLKLNNLIAFLDYNKIDQDGKTADVLPLNFKQEWESYNWQVIEVKGYDVEEIYNAVKKAQQHTDKPTMIILDTIKAKGVSFMEDLMYKGNPKWHGQAPKGDEYDKAVAELTEKYHAIATQEPQDIDSYIASISMCPEHKTFLTTTVQENVREIQQIPYYKPGESIATRDTFGDMLLILGKADDRIVILSAGVAGSVKYQKFIETFGTFSAANRKGRFIQCGIAEANLAGVAAGMALAGKKPWLATFDIFIKEMLSVIRNSICYAKLDVKIVGTHAGAGVEEDGGSHQSILEPEIMTDLPNMEYYEPADGNETVDVMALTWKRNKAAYLRLTRQPIPVLDRSYVILPEKGLYVLKNAGQETVEKHVYLIGVAATLQHCLAAAEQLEQQGIACTVLNALSMSFIAENCAAMFNHNALVVTVHDAHYASLAKTVAYALATGKHQARVIGLGLHSFGESGKIDELYKKHGFDVESIVKTVKKELFIQ